MLRRADTFKNPWIIPISWLFKEAPHYSPIPFCPQLDKSSKSRFADMEGHEWCSFAPKFLFYPFLFTHLNIYHLQTLHVLQHKYWSSGTWELLGEAGSGFPENLMPCQGAKPGQRHQPGKCQQILQTGETTRSTKSKLANSWEWGLGFSIVNPSAKQARTQNAEENEINNNLILKVTIKIPLTSN